MSTYGPAFIGIEQGGKFLLLLFNLRLH